MELNDGVSQEQGKGMIWPLMPFFHLNDSSVVRVL
jgi:hypothetical protein